jgi:hypothetical protein
VDCGAFVQEILLNPSKLAEESVAYALLNCWLRGYPVSALQPWLTNSEEKIVETGIWIASELGDKAAPLIHDAVAVLRHRNVTIRYYALDVVAVCAVGNIVSIYVHVPPALQDADKGVAERAMWLMSSAETGQLRAALAHYERDPENVHTLGLQLLVGGTSNNMDEDVVLAEWINSCQFIRKAYGAIWSQRNIGRFPHLAYEVAKSECELIRGFGHRMKTKLREASQRQAEREARMIRRKMRRESGRQGKN